MSHSAATFSRRHFARAAALVSTAASLPFYNEFALAQTTRGRVEMPDSSGDGVYIGLNENPLGPCKEAIEALASVAPRCGRYEWPESEAFPKLVAAQEGVPVDHVNPYAGSSDPLYRAVCAFTSPARGLVMADPGYEPTGYAAEFLGAKVKRIPLTRDYRHDVKAMVASMPEAGLFYICNPNNPTGTLTPPEDIQWLLQNKPKGSVLLLDEAYLHFSNAPSAAPLVKKGEDVVILRTFSKLYGMAGLRVGTAMGRPDLLNKLAQFGGIITVNAGMAAATAALKVETLIPERRRINRENREEVLAFLKEKGIRFVPSQSNKFMMDAGRPGQELIAAMAKRNVFIGRVWPIWPNWVRVTIGTQRDMERFKKALLEVRS